MFFFESVHFCIPHLIDAEAFLLQPSSLVAAVVVAAAAPSSSAVAFVEYSA